MGAPFRVVPLDAAHDRSGFDCESPELTRYFQQQASQDVRRRFAACFVALHEEGRVAGYYTLASTGILLADLPAGVAKKLPRYPTVPAVRMGRLAVDRSFKGQGLGGALLADALARSAHAEIAAWAMVVDARDDVAARFYAHHGFIALPDAARTLFLPLATVRHLR